VLQAWSTHRPNQSQEPQNACRLVSVAEKLAATHASILCSGTGRQTVLKQRWRNRTRNRSASVVAHPQFKPSARPSSALVTRGPADRSGQVIDGVIQS
jgi:hypothetical protein